MRLFYNNEGPIDTLLQIAAKPIWDGDLVSKSARDHFVEFGWVARCQGYNIITPLGVNVCRALALYRHAGDFQQGIGESNVGTMRQ